jgi:hypothetical protein
MMAKANTFSNPQRLYVLVALLVLLGVVVVYRMIGRSGLVGGLSSDKEITYARRSLPTLIAPEFSTSEGVRESSRNPFTFGVPPTPTPNLTPPPTRPPMPTRPPTPTPTATPVGWRGPPPPFDREYIGHFGPLELQVAAFRKGGDDPELSEIEVAAVGDALPDSQGEDLFIVLEVGLESVVIGFVGWEEEVRVPLAEN